MAEVELRVKITGRPTVINAIETWLEDEANYQALMSVIADATEARIQESGILGKKRISVNADDQTLMNSVRRSADRRKTQQKMDDVVNRKIKDDGEL